MVLRRKAMNAKKERELFAAGLEGLLRKENKIVEEYRALAELIEDIPAGLLFDWVITEGVAHHTLLCAIISSVKQTPQKEKGNGADSVGMERDKVLRWIERLRLKEQAVAADCCSLRSQACWEEEGDLIDALLDALLMDSKKHQGILLAVEKMLKV